VRPTTLGAVWRTVLVKEQPGELVYALYAGSQAGVPYGIAYTQSAEHQAKAGSALPLNAWTHLAATYDGVIVRLFVNGVQAATASAAGTMPNSTGALRLGGNAVWSEWFGGLIDEVRVYNRALSTAQIQADMNTPLP
jgi:concanavalin A-like lectin/glucanase superfamily protein